VELKVSSKAIRLDQLTEEIRALPGLSRVQGLSACGPSRSGDFEVTVHVEGLALSADEERLVNGAVARHLPDPQWGVSEEEKELAAILSRSEGILSLADLEKALRLVARTLAQARPEVAGAITAIRGSEER